MQSTTNPGYITPQKREDDRECERVQGDLKKLSLDQNAKDAPKSGQGKPHSGALANLAARRQAKEANARALAQSKRDDLANQGAKVIASPAFDDHDTSPSQASSFGSIISSSTSAHPSTSSVAPNARIISLTSPWAAEKSSSDGSNAFDGPSPDDKVAIAQASSKSGSA